MLEFFCGDITAALEQGAIRNPERPGYMNRFVVWCRGKATGGNARGLCTCQDYKTAQWLRDRLTEAEQHQPWTGDQIPS